MPAAVEVPHGRTLNSSRGGARLELHHSVPLRSVVSLNLVLEDRILDVGGVVVYPEAIDGDRCCMGVEFTELDPEGQALLEEFVECSEAEDEGTGGD